MKLHHGIIAALLGAAPIYAQGPLAPPAGPPQPNLRTLEQLEPRIPVNATTCPGSATYTYVITAPGSYYLTGNIVALAGKGGIEIAANHVKLDLMGFTMSGNPGTLDGIYAASRAGTVIRNGSIAYFAGDGINLQRTPNFSKISRIENIVADGNGGTGILTDDVSSVKDCSATYNGGDGISIESGSRIEACVASGNTGVGIRAFEACSITSCVANLNGVGFLATQSANISQCTADFNRGEGIYVYTSSRIIDNRCRQNGLNSGTAGIRVNGERNHIEGNTCTNGYYGIKIDGTFNLIVRNRCSVNGINWSISNSNAFGPIVAVTYGAAVTGSGPAASTLGTTDPNANFTY